MGHTPLLLGAQTEPDQEPWRPHAFHAKISLLGFCIVAGCDSGLPAEHLEDWRCFRSSYSRNYPLIHVHKKISLSRRFCGFRIYTLVCFRALNRSQKLLRWSNEPKSSPTRAFNSKFMKANRRGHICVNTQYFSSDKPGNTCHFCSLRVGRLCRAINFLSIFVDAPLSHSCETTLRAN